MRGHAPSRRIGASRRRGGELDAIRRDTTMAIEDSVAAVEALLSLPASDIDACHTFVTGRAMAILEACCVDDITNQRVAKALNPLSVIERRMSAFSAAMGAGEEEADAETALERRARENILHGPALERVALGEIDALFSTATP